MNWRCIVLVLYPIWATAQEGGIHFEQGLTWAQVKAKAKAERKYIFVDGYTTWCAPCKYMSDHIFPLEKVGDSINPRFISIQVQLDSTDHDSDAIRRQYALAGDLNSRYQITVYPTYLFFSPEGKIVHRAGGSSEDPDEFVQKALDALNPDWQYYTLLGRYEAGARDSTLLLHLGMASLKIGKIRQAEDIGNVYVNSVTCVLGKTNLLFLGQVTKDTTDLGFKLWLTRHTAIDSIISNDYAERKIMNVIIQEDPDIREVSRKAAEGLELVGTMGGEPMYKAIDKVPEQAPPDWKKVYDGIYQQFGSYFADRLTTWEKLSYYSTRQEWSHYDQAIVDYVQSYRSTLNDRNLDKFAWELFRHIEDTTILEKALQWISGTLSSKDDIVYDYVDTYANLLYKLQRRDEALREEERALALAPEAEKHAFEEKIEKMKQGLKTWD